MARTDINEYANGLLLEFLDAFHGQLKADLQQVHGDQWFEQGIQRHFRADYFERTRQMLESPMRVVDMGKNDDEIYGVEHLSNIVSGNWKDIYRERFGDRARTEVWLKEIAEIRHNVSHRRRRHFLRRSELGRFAHTCAVLLRAIGSPDARRFEHRVESLTAGATPWGAPLTGHVPAQDEIVDEFVGREHQLRDLSGWLAGDSPQLLVWGYGSGEERTRFRVCPPDEGGGP